MRVLLTLFLIFVNCRFDNFVFGCNKKNVIYSNKYARFIVSITFSFCKFVFAIVLILQNDACVTCDFYHDIQNRYYTLKTNAILKINIYINLCQKTKNHKTAAL